MPDENVVYFVLSGEMYSGRVLGFVDIDINISCDHTAMTRPEIAHKILLNHNLGNSFSDSSKQLNTISERPGRWYYLSGVRIVHSDDCYESRELAADAYKKYLLR